MTGSGTTRFITHTRWNSSGVEPENSSTAPAMKVMRAMIMGATSGTQSPKKWPTLTMDSRRSSAS